MKKRLTSIILVLIFFIGLSVMLYPSIANFVNSKVQSSVIADYDEMLKNMTEEDFSAFFKAADEYNVSLSELADPLSSYSLVEGYTSALNVSGNGVMGYIDIDKIKVELPIYHGTSDEVLARAVGHVEGSSLPIGGPSTHCVMSAHRGLPSAKLFTNLDKLEEGDIFTITVLNRVLTYEVCSVMIVEPQDTAALNIVEGKDYCTLVTCTPYGINTHRLLVRGERIENVAQKPIIYVKNEGYIIDPVIVAPAVAVPMLLILLVFLLTKYNRKRSDKMNEKDIDTIIDDILTDNADGNTPNDEISNDGIEKTPPKNEPRQ